MSVFDRSSPPPGPVSRGVDPPVPARLTRPLRPLQVLLSRRRIACRHLGLAVPRDVAQGPPETLAYRVATLDRWIGRALDRAGGVRLPPPDPDDPLEEEDGGEDEAAFDRGDRPRGPRRRNSRPRPEGRP